MLVCFDGLIAREIVTLGVIYMSSVCHSFVRSSCASSRQICWILMSAKFQKRLFGHNSMLSHFRINYSQSSSVCVCVSVALPNAIAAIINALKWTIWRALPRNHNIMNVVNSLGTQMRSSDFKHSTENSYKKMKQNLIKIVAVNLQFANWNRRQTRQQNYCLFEKLGTPMSVYSLSSPCPVSSCSFWMQ